MNNVKISQYAKAYIINGGFVSAKKIEKPPEEKLPENIYILTIDSEWKYPSLSSRKEIVKKLEVFDPVKVEISIDGLTYKGEFIKNFLHSWRIRGPDIEETGDADSAENLPCDIIDIMYDGILAIGKKAEDELGKV